MDKNKEFYNAWAIQQMNDKTRETVLKWKAINFLNLLLRNKLVTFNKVCEIGGAEGFLLNTLDKNIDITHLNNYDISSTFCEAGKKMFPKIVFKNYEFLANPEKHDLVMLSDITEHVENDYKFLEVISKYCNYLLIKIPIEKAFINSWLFYAIRLKKIPKELKYGKSHVNGHLRGYSKGDANNLISKYFKVVDLEVSDVAYFNPSRKKSIIKRILGKHIFICIYGGAYFALCRSNPATPINNN